MNSSNPWSNSENNLTHRNEANQSRRGEYSTLESENDNLESSLKDKVKALKAISIDIGSEVRDQIKFLRDMDDDFDKSGGFLDKAMRGVKRLGTGSHNHIILYLFLFSLVFFMLLWLLIKFS